jgi:hypothetical protein
MGERRVSTPRLVRVLTLCRWSQMGSLLHAILAFPTQPLRLVLFATGTGKCYILDREKGKSGAGQPDIDERGRLGLTANS